MCASDGFGGIMMAMRGALHRAGLAGIGVLLLLGSAMAQGLPGLPGLPSPPAPVEMKPDCSEAGVKDKQRQLEQLETLERTAPETIGLVCAGVEAFSRWMEWKDDEPLPDAINSLAKELLHQNLTPRMIKAMCRQAQGDAGRNMRTEIGQLKAQLQACKGI
jgi:hypothetical protein